MARLYIHPLPIRIWHWLNAAGFVAMVLTGLQIRYVGVVDVLPFRLALRLHNLIGFALIFNFFLWAGTYATSPRGRNYLPDLNLKRFFADSMRQMKYYCWGMFAGEPNPHRITPNHKFNPMQAALYQLVMLVLLPAQFITGVLLWNIRRFATPIDLLGGLRVVDTVHVLLFIFFVAYILVHPYLGTLGATRTGQYRAMISGYEEVDDTAPAAPAANAEATHS